MDINGDKHSHASAEKADVRSHEDGSQSDEENGEEITEQSGIAGLLAGIALASPLNDEDYANDGSDDDSQGDS